jgi:hypothetical protein
MTSIPPLTDSERTSTLEAARGKLAREDELVRQAQRLTERYIREVVLNFGLCPWAPSALETKRVAITPILGKFRGRSSAPAAASALLAKLNSTPQTVELVLAPYPELSMTRPEFDDVARELRLLDREKNFALAAFHPAPVAEMTEPSRAAMFLRRSPDPMIQVVRSDVLAQIGAAEGEGTTFVELGSLLAALVNPESRSIRSRVLEHNFATLRREGPPRFEAIFQDLLEDRSQSYERIEQRFSGRGGT